MQDSSPPRAGRACQIKSVTRFSHPFSATLRLCGSQALPSNLLTYAGVLRWKRRGNGAWGHMLDLTWNIRICDPIPTWQRERHNPRERVQGFPPGACTQGPWQAAIEAAVADIEGTDTDCRVLDIGANAGAFLCVPLALSASSDCSHGLWRRHVTTSRQG